MAFSQAEILEEFVETSKLGRYATFVEAWHHRGWWGRRVAVRGQRPKAFNCTVHRRHIDEQLRASRTAYPIQACRVVHVQCPNCGLPCEQREGLTYLMHPLGRAFCPVAA